LNWIPKFNPHTFFSSTAGDADNLPASVRRGAGLAQRRPTVAMYEQFPEM
jgi:hypothetical protein